MTNQKTLTVIIALLATLALACATLIASEQTIISTETSVRFQMETISTEEAENPSDEPATVEPSHTLEPTATLEPSETPEPTAQETIFPKEPTTEPLVNIFNILGKPVGEVEQILGASILVTPNDDYDDRFSGGEYRDYNLSNYTVDIAYDKNGIARVFQVMDGLSAENYSLDQWNIILPRFGVYLNENPSRKALAAIYWDNYHDYFIAVVASSTKGQPVWSIQIAQVGYEK